jgi:hypothetical protein
VRGYNFGCKALIDEDSNTSTYAIFTVAEIAFESINVCRLFFYIINPSFSQADYIRFMGVCVES